MNIDFFTPYITGYGGMEQAINRVAQGLTDRGHRIRIWSEKPPEDAWWCADWPHFWVGESFSSWPDRISLQIAGLLRGWDKYGRPDMVVCLGAVQTLAARTAAEAGDVRPKVLNWMHFTLSRMEQPEFLSVADGALAITRAQADQYKAKWPQLPVTVVYNPTACRPSCPVIKRSLTARLVFVGRLWNKQKRLDRLFGVLSTIPGDWHLQIVGDGPDRQALEELAHRLGIISRLTWNGWQTNPWCVIEEASALVVSSDYEGFPLVIIEALQRGLPVCATDCPDGPREVIRHNINGWLVPITDSVAFRGVLKKIIDEPLNLPDIDVCQQSVEPFKHEAVMDRWENALWDYRGGKG